MRFCFQSVGDDEATEEESLGRGRERAERERDREVDEEIESRISSAMCQTAPVGVFTSIQYL